ncbi:MAG: C40 family peptidase [Bacteroidota bacterium]|nr:C40 family peptidase [Bacteroidota bacterium]
MNFGVCCLSVVPVRADASDKSEMVSQLLFGETFSIQSSSKGWAKIVIDHDHYEGWIDEKQYTPLSNQEYGQLLTWPRYFSTDLIHNIDQKGYHSFPILRGSILYNSTGSEFSLGENTFVFDGHTVDAGIKPTADNFIMNAIPFLNSPYTWGGRNPFGIDCSGFVQIVARLSGITLPRDTWQQAEEGELINLIPEAHSGDLAFFDNEEGRIIHVGILLDNAQIIHASGKVRIDTVDHQGIFRKDIKKYSHQLRVIKRIIP